LITLETQHAPSKSDESELELKLVLVAKFGDEKEIASDVVVVVFASFDDENCATALALCFAFPEDFPFDSVLRVS
jgi:hypothetical protein